MLLVQKSGNKPEDNKKDRKTGEMNIFGQTCSIVSGQRDRINQICTRGLSHGARKTSTALGNRYNERGQKITCSMKHQ